MKLISSDPLINTPIETFSNNDRSVYIKHYGCTTNKFDFKIIVGYLIKAGYKIVDSPEKGNIIIVNTCGVKQPTEDKIIQKIRFFNSLNKHLIITGCLSKINLSAIKKAAPDFSAILGPRSLDKILPAIKRAKSGRKNKIYFSKKPIKKLLQPSININPVIETISISEGCNGSCTYCCVRFARGALFSYSQKNILKHIKKAILEGIKEIWLTSQDNGSYGLDRGTNLVELLLKCCNIKGKFMIRVGMMNPGKILKFLPELIDTYKNKKIFKFLHIPVQSGSDKLLKSMNREYMVKDFKNIVRNFKEKIPNITLSTDVICGFPAETEEDFKSTLKLINQIKPDIINISKFFPRPKTMAERMKQINPNIVKERSRRISHYKKRITYERNKIWQNWSGEIIIDEKGKDFSWIGRNFAYKPIVIKEKKDLLGRLINVKVSKIFSNYLEADIVYS
jgi:MiaB-like tRNA modifying enzyme